MRGLLAPALERRLRRRLTVEIDEGLSQSLSHWAVDKSIGLLRILRFALVQLFPVVLLQFILNKHGVQAAAVWISLWWLAALLLESMELQQRFFRAKTADAVESNLPLSDQDLFDLHWADHCQKGWERFGGALVVGWLLVGMEGPGSLLGLIVFAVLHWLSYGALMSFCTARLTYEGMRTAACAVLVGLAAMFVAENSWLVRFGSEASILMSAVPTGWALHVLFWVGNPTTAAVLALVPILVLVWRSRSWVARLRSGYQFKEAESGSIRFANEMDIEPSGKLAVILHEPARIDVGLGFIEQKIFDWLTSRERLVWEAYGEFPYHISRSWLKSWPVVIGYVLFVVWMRPGASSIFWIGPLGLIILLLISREELTARKRRACGGFVGERYLGAFPICITELMRVEWKGAVIRTGAHLPQLFVFGILCALTISGGLGPSASVSWNIDVLVTGIGMALEFAALLLLSFPYWFLMECTGTPNAGRGTLAELWRLLVTILLMFAVSGSMGCVLVSSSVIGNLLGWTGFAAAMRFSYVYYLRWLQAGEVDLVQTVGED